MFYGPDERGQTILRGAITIISQLFGRSFHADNLIALDRSMGFHDDAPFMRAFEAHATTEQERSLVWRLHTLVWAARHCIHLPGDFVECGVWRGFCSRVLLDVVDVGGAGKRHWLFDTFDGIPDEHAAGGPTPAGAYAEPGLLESVRQRFEGVDAARIVPGAVPGSLHQPDLERIALLHLDMNSASAEVAALEVLFERVVPGGMIVLDDYGWHAYRNQKVAEDAFMAAHDHAILELPTGQGLVVRR